MKIVSRGSIAALLVAALPASTLAEIATFNFAQVGQSYSAFFSGSNPLVGQQVVHARIYLDVDIFAGSDAANFFTDISFPIQPLPGNENAFALFGEDQNWSGAGVFHYFEDTTRFNGVFAPGRFGAETPGLDYDGTILEGSRIEFDYIPEPATAALLGIAGLTLRRRRVPPAAESDAESGAMAR